MIHTELNKGNIGNLLARYETALKNNKPPTQLFDVEPNWASLKERRCPICNNKLLFPRGKSISFCKGKKHGDKKQFVIKNQTLLKNLGLKSMKELSPHPD